jgi:hypothetical protein
MHSPAPSAQVDAYRVPVFVLVKYFTFVRLHFYRCLGRWQPLASEQLSTLISTPLLQACCCHTIPQAHLLFVCSCGTPSTHTSRTETKHFNRLRTVQAHVHVNTAAVDDLGWLPGLLLPHDPSSSFAVCVFMRNAKHTYKQN